VRYVIAVLLSAGCLAPPAEVARGCASPSLSPACRALGPLPQPPIIDGIVECGVELQPADMSWSLPGAVPSEFAVRWAAAYTPEGLYAFAEMQKPQVFTATEQSVAPWCGDAFHLYLDSDGVFNAPPKYDAIGTKHFICTAPPSRCFVLSDREGTAFPRTRPPVIAGSQFTTVAFDGGLRFEAFVTAQELGVNSLSLDAGQLVGLSLSINAVRQGDPLIDGRCYARSGELTLQLASGAGTVDARHPRATPAAFCRPTIVPAEPLIWLGGCQTVPSSMPLVCLVFWARKQLRRRRLSN
jgi:hypothetical protein